jgi:hypothetical protein
MRVVTKRSDKVTELHSEVVTDLGRCWLALKVKLANTSGKASTVSVPVSGGMCQFVNENAKHLEHVRLHGRDENLVGVVSRCTGRVVLTDGTVQRPSMTRGKAASHTNAVRQGKAVRIEERTQFIDCG